MASRLEKLASLAPAGIVSGLLESSALAGIVSDFFLRTSAMGACLLAHAYVGLDGLTQRSVGVSEMQYG